MGAAMQMIAVERQRQIAAEGWTPEHDDEHRDGEMLQAGMCYYLHAIGQSASQRDGIPREWPWDRCWWKPKGEAGDMHNRDLERAGALLLAERERLLRADLGFGHVDHKINLIARADLTHVHLELEMNGAAKFQSQAMRRQWRKSEQPRSSRIIFPRGSFPSRENRKAGTAQLPLIPVHLRPRTALDSYHILWEAEWTPTPPRDPYLLRRIGEGDLWLVVAAWDLTEVERGALATRVTPN